MRTEKLTLGEVASITAGQSPPGHTYNEDGLGLPFFQGKADFGEVQPVARKWCTAPKKTAETGDILISVRAPVGPTNIAGEKCCIGRGLAAIRPDESLALRDFILWTIKYREPELIAKGQGSTFAAIKQKDLTSLPILLPPLDEQRRIAGILNRAEKIDRLRARAAERLQEFIPALFIKMFGDPAEARAGSKSMNATVQLGDVAEIRSGSINPQKQPETLFELYSIPGFDNDQTPERLPGSEIKSNKTRLPHRGVLFSKLNPRINRVWTINEPANATRISSTEFVCLVPDERRLDLDFLSWRLRVSNIAKQLPVATAAATKSRERIQPKSLLRLDMPLPPLDAQKQFAKIAARAQTIAKFGDSSRNSTSALTASLMSRLLRDAA